MCLMRLVNKVKEIMAKANSKDFLLNTDFEMDKIIYVKEGKINSPQTVTFPHNLPFRPLLFGLCSFNEDFSAPKPSPYSQNPKFVGSPIPMIVDDISFIIQVDGDNVEVDYKNNVDSNKPIYYRIYGFEPTDSHAKIPPTMKYAKKFTLNTDRDYRKLYKKGIVNIGSSITINHDFGYIPQVMLWYDLPAFGDGFVTNDISVSDSSPDYITNKQVIINYPAQPDPLYAGAKIHYRIYCDEA